MDVIQKQFEVEWEHFKFSLIDFYEGVDWKEPFIVSLLTFHVLLFLIVLLTRKRHNVQIFLFFTLVALVWLSRSINDFCLAHWKEFARFEYFDKQGFFISLMFSAPLLLCTFLILINFLRELFSLLVKVKTEEIKKNRKTKARNEKKQN